tara:strand:- start:591 stop:1307 length:717 start_codon:yes stop_codon:yes gene_type:complete
MIKNPFRYFNKSYWLRKFYISKISKIFFSNKFVRKNTFKHIYLSSHWQNYFKVDENKSVSGPGSDLKYTNNLSEKLINFFKNNNIKRILDIGCGDFLWMNLLLNKYEDYNDYLGVDIVSELIDNNINKYSNEKISFKIFDLVEDEIPQGFDIILVRDVFIHLKNDQIKYFLDKLKKNNSIFFGVTSTPKLNENKELKAVGRYRDINIEISPYNLKNFITQINENDEKDSFNIYKISNI